jgi:hypothetical protein
MHPQKLRGFATPALSTIPWGSPGGHPGHPEESSACDTLSESHVNRKQLTAESLLNPDGDISSGGVFSPAIAPFSASRRARGPEKLCRREVKCSTMGKALPVSSGPGNTGRIPQIGPKLASHRGRDGTAGWPCGPSDPFFALKWEKRLALGSEDGRSRR